MRKARYGGPEDDSKQGSESIADQFIADFAITCDRLSNDPVPTMRALWAGFKAHRNRKPFDDYAAYLLDGITEGRILPADLTAHGYSKGLVNQMVQSTMHGQKIPAVRKPR